MGFTNKAQYLIALLRMLPFGLLALYYGIQGLVVETKISSLNKVAGEVVFNGTKNIYSKLSNMRKDAYVFQINENNDTIECYTPNGHVEIPSGTHTHLRYKPIVANTILHELLVLPQHLFHSEAQPWLPVQT